MGGVDIGNEGSGGCAGWINDGDWTAYKNVDFGSGASAFTVNSSPIFRKDGRGLFMPPVKNALLTLQKTK